MPLGNTNGGRRDAGVHSNPISTSEEPAAYGRSHAGEPTFEAWSGRHWARVPGYEATAAQGSDPLLAALGKRTPKRQREERRGRVPHAGQGFPGRGSVHRASGA